MVQRRRYGRIIVELDCVLYYKNFECEAKIKNISEEGICFECELSDEMLAIANDLQSVIFNSIDVYTHFFEEVTSFILGTGKIVRYEVTGNTLILGCSLINPSNELLTYIANKKVDYFIKYHDLSYESGDK